MSNDIKLNIKKVEFYRNLYGIQFEIDVFSNMTKEDFNNKYPIKYKDET